MVATAATGAAGAAGDAAAATADVCRHANVGDRRYGALFPEFPTFDCDDGYAFTAPVGSFPANAFGLQDMLGNAWEWVADCVTPDLSRHPRDGRAADIAVPGADCTRRVMRGGDPVPATRLVVIGFCVVSEPARSR